MSRRTERLGSLLQQELAVIIQRELTDPRITGFPSVTRVNVAEDLSQADVYLTVMGTPTQQNLALTAIRHAGGMMRSILTKSLTIRQVPFLRFHIDEQLKKEMAILNLLKQVDNEKEEMEEREARQAEIDAAEAAAEEKRQADIEARRAAARAAEDAEFEADQAAKAAAAHAADSDEDELDEDDLDESDSDDDSDDTDNDTDSATEDDTDAKPAPKPERNE